jgi:HAD superfamily hydrolase (TIGR01549 family)
MAASAILFDLDGTIWDSYPCYATALRKRIGGTVNSIVARLRGGENAIGLARQCGLTNANFSTLCRNSFEHLQLYPNVRETLVLLSERETQLGVVTSLPQWLGQNLLNEFGLTRYFVTTQYNSKKPSPSGILKALNELDSLDSVYYVGDSPVDAQAASRAGVLFAWSSYGYYDESPTDVDVVLETFSDLLRL